MYKKILLQTMLLLCALVAGSGSVWADEVVIYTLDGTTTGGSNGYATESEITQNNITWMVMGNTTTNPWRIGGKNLDDVDRPLYSTSAVSSDNITKVVVTNGTNTATVNSMTLIVSSNQDFSNPTSTLTGSFASSSTTTFERPTGVDWSDKYFKLVYNVDAGSSNQYAQFIKAEFYKESGSTGPTQLDAPTLTATASNGAVTLEWSAVTNASSYTIQYADNDQFTNATTITDAESPQEISGLTNGTTYYFKAMTVGDGTNYLSSDYGTVVSATPDNVARITITQDNLVDFTNSYDWYDWSSGGISGRAFAYKNNGIQFNTSKDAYWIYNSVAVPGNITSIKMVKVSSATDRSWTLRLGSEEITTTNGGSDGGSKTVGEAGTTWNVSGNYSYFLLYPDGNTNIASIEITYVPSTTPNISASNVSIEHDATSGSISYTINNEPDPAGTLTAEILQSGSIANLTLGTITSSTVPFTCSANNETTDHTATVRLTYTYNTNETVTKDVTITQAAKVLPTPTVTIDATGITNTNVYDGTAAGNLSATVTYNEAPVAGATVTWSGNDDTVATIDATTGAVTLVGAGSVTFTATYNGNASYNGATATYAMTVTNTDPNDFDITLNRDFWGLPSANGQISNTSISGEMNNVKVTLYKGSGSQLYTNASQTRFYNGSYFVFEAPANYVITSITFTADGNYHHRSSQTFGAGTGTGSQYGWTGSAGIVALRSMATWRCTSVNVKLAEVTSASVTVGSALYATYVPDANVTFPSSLKAYIVPEITDNAIKLSPVTTVPAHTPVIVEATAANTYSLTIEDNASAVGTNLLKASDGLTVSGDASTIYVLAQTNGKVGFSLLTNTGNSLLSYGKAYLIITDAARQFIPFEEGGDATTIKEVNETQFCGKTYDLNGREVSNPQKGVYIQNGKKIVIK